MRRVHEGEERKYFSWNIHAMLYFQAFLNFICAQENSVICSKHMPTLNAFGVKGFSLPAGEIISRTLVFTLLFDICTFN